MLLLYLAGNYVTETSSSPLCFLIIGMDFLSGDRQTVW